MKKLITIECSVFHDIKVQSRRQSVVIDLLLKNIGVGEVTVND